MSELRGIFGLNSDSMVPGALHLEENGSFILELDDFIFQPEQLDMSKPNMVSYSGDPAKIVTDYLPRDIIGILEDGQQITLFRALMQSPSFLFSPVRQTFHSSVYLTGAHLHGDRDYVDGLRWAWQLPANMNLERERSPVSVDGLIPGTLKAWTHNRFKGLQFTTFSPTPLRTLRNQVQHSSGQLLGLWSARKVPQAARIEVLAGGSWHVLTVAEDDLTSRARSSFMPDQDLTLSMFASWIPLARQIEPLHFILNGLTKTLQLDAQVLATGLEGLHRRLFEDRVRFEGISKRAVERAAREARYAGVPALILEGFADEKYAHTVFKEVLHHLNQVTYQNRVMEILLPVYKIVPSLFGPDLARWVQMVKNIRNNESHQLTQEFNESSIAIYYVAVESCRWAMVLRILLQLCPEYDFQSSLARSERFSYALANIDREELWPGFFALDEFRAQTKGSESSAQ